MALWQCGGCGTSYAVGLPRCPHCHSTEWTEDGMPKILGDGTVTFESGHEPDGYPRPSAPGAPEAAEAVASEPETSPAPVKAAVKPSAPPPPPPVAGG